MAREDIKNDIKDFKISPFKADFPILKDMVGKYSLTYLDTSASAQKPKSVIDRIAYNYTHEYANVHRGLYPLSANETAFLEEARGKVATFIGATSPNEIIFTKGATEAINLFAYTWGWQNLKAGDEVIISAAEHHANIVPWHILRDKTGLVLKIAKVTKDGDFDMDDFKALLSPRTKLVSITQMSNVLGTFMPIKEITALAHAQGAIVMIDGAQGVAHTHTNVTDIDCDFYAFSGHKLYGPTGIGVLYGKKALLEKLDPWQGGGDMVKSVCFTGTTYTTAPVRFEAGTPPFVEAIGLGAAIDYVNEKGLAAILNQEDKVFAYLYESIKSFDGATILGNAKNKGGLVSFVIKDMNPQDMAMILSHMGICIRVGHHCAQPIVNFMGYDAVARASLGCYSGTEDVDALMAGLAKAKDMLK